MYLSAGRQNLTGKEAGIIYLTLQLIYTTALELTTFTI
jgi:hypothetical protein